MQRKFIFGCGETYTMADNKISTPSSSAGLVRFSDVTTSKIQISPEIVMGAAILFIAVEIAFHLMK